MEKTREKSRLTYLGPELDQAVSEFLEREGLQFSAVSRELWAKRIGRPELAGAVKRGRPTPTPKEPAKTRRKSRIKSHEIASKTAKNFGSS
jgi:hypothetical protein